MVKITKGHEITLNMVTTQERLRLISVGPCFTQQNFRNKFYSHLLCVSALPECFA